jgi:hypothetical protein
MAMRERKYSGNFPWPTTSRAVVCHQGRKLTSEASPRDPLPSPIPHAGGAVGIPGVKPLADVRRSQPQPLNCGDARPETAGQQQAKSAARPIAKGPAPGTQRFNRPTHQGVGSWLRSSHFTRQPGHHPPLQSSSPILGRWGGSPTQLVKPGGEHGDAPSGGPDVIR